MKNTYPLPDKGTVLKLLSNNKKNVNMEIVTHVI